MIEAHLRALEPARFEPILDARRWQRVDTALQRGAAAMEGRNFVHINSTMTGGGVAEILASALGYFLGAGVRSRWLVLEGTEDFFVITKRIHHLLHGKEGDGGHLGRAEADVYRSVLAAEFERLAAHVRPGDVVVLHDPQVAGLAPPLRDLGANVIWNCHIGADTPNQHSRRAWKFLLPAVSKAEAQVFSRAPYVWEGLDRDRVAVIPPCIDAFSPKNQEMDADQIHAILGATRLVEGPCSGEPTFFRADGTAACVRGAIEVVGESSVPFDAPLVTQVSRWDPLKDHAGVARAFAEAVPEELGAHLVLAGPSPNAVADDPEESATLEELRRCVGSLPGAARARVHVACLPVDDTEENAAVVNALQRGSDVIVQKSLAEGFGLTVAEAMWKGRPTVASRVGGIQDQISDGVNGILVDDPEDLDGFGSAVSELLKDRTSSADLGRAARESVVDNFLAPSYLCRYLGLVEQVVSG